MELYFPRLSGSNDSRSYDAVHAKAANEVVQKLIANDVTGIKPMP
jgi:hypothetical protein